MKPGIVFDMDKCIGFFTQVAVFHDILEELSRPLKTNEYFDLFDMCPEIFRPGIFKVFKYLSKIKKKTKSKVIIYTNNNGPPSWATNIRKYIEYKIKKRIFDRTIKGWKYNNKIVEKNRQGYAKSWKDLLKCTSLNKNDKIIFFDDREEHDKMRHKNVDYQLVKPYKVKIEYKTFINRFMKSKLKRKLGNKITRNQLEKSLLDDGYIPSVLPRKYSNDDIMKPLVEFMKKNRKKTRRRRMRKGGRRITLKNKGASSINRAPHTLPNTTTQEMIDAFNREQYQRMMEIILERRANLTQMNVPEGTQDQIVAQDLENMNQDIRAQAEQQQRMWEQQQGRVVTARPRDINRRGPATRRELQRQLEQLERQAQTNTETGIATQTIDSDDD